MIHITHHNYFYNCSIGDGETPHHYNIVDLWMQLLATCFLPHVLMRIQQWGNYNIVSVRDPTLPHASPAQERDKEKYLFSTRLVCCFIGEYITLLAW